VTNQRGKRGNFELGILKKAQILPIFVAARVFQRVRSGFLIPAYGSKQLFRKPPVILKIVPKAANEM